MKRCLSSGKSKDSCRISTFTESRLLLALNSNLKVNPHVPVASRVDRVILHCGNTPAKMCNYGGSRQRIGYTYKTFTRDMSAMPQEKLGNILSNY